MVVEVKNKSNILIIHFEILIFLWFNFKKDCYLKEKYINIKKIFELLLNLYY